MCVWVCVCEYNGAKCHICMYIRHCGWRGGALPNFLTICPLLFFTFFVVCRLWLFIFHMLTASHTHTFIYIYTYINIYIYMAAAGIFLCTSFSYAFARSAFAISFGQSKWLLHCKMLHTFSSILPAPVCVCVYMLSKSVCYILYIHTHSHTHICISKWVQVRRS